MVDRSSRNHLQRRSKFAFGSDHRLTISAELLRRIDEAVDKSTIADATGVPPTSAYMALHELVELGVVGRVRDGKRSLFKVVQGPYWDWCRELIARAGATRET